ncbi:lytic transglycosylase domain-containing protein [Clostridioides mangenotii]|uniref:lytic transglycosylase domain-containing protein n=1 Tax=Metaclostridioides mangenotii TaxID=1540 RepID=UPI001C126DE9|nr:lytic transglycosylase domain-containing protein [Clostridioides mangenotii]
MNKKKILVLFIFIILFGSFLYEKKVVHKFIYPQKYSEYVEKYSKEFNLDKNIVYSVIKVESKFDCNAVSKKDAKGLMQIRDITRDWAAEELDLKNVDIFDPETNIRIGCWYLSKLYKEFGRLDLVIAAYNGGSGNVRKWLNDDKYSKDGENLHSIPFDQTSNYVKKVKKNYREYKNIYEKDESK